MPQGTKQRSTAGDAGGGAYFLCLLAAGNLPGVQPVTCDLSDTAAEAKARIGFLFDEFQARCMPGEGVAHLAGRCGGSFCRAAAEEALRALVSSRAALHAAVWSGPARRAELPRRFEALGQLLARAAVPFAPRLLTEERPAAGGAALRERVAAQFLALYGTRETAPYERLLAEALPSAAAEGLSAADCGYLLDLAVSGIVLGSDGTADLSDALRGAFARADSAAQFRRAVRELLGAPAFPGGEGGGEGPHTALVREMIRHLEQCGAARPTAAELSARFHLSAAQLGRLFRRETGLAPARYHHLLRIQRALELLARAPELEIGEIAERAGYASPYDFSKAFKQVTGFSPREYRALAAAGTGSRQN